MVGAAFCPVGYGACRRKEKRTLARDEAEISFHPSPRGLFHWHLFTSQIPGSSPRFQRTLGTKGGRSFHRKTVKEGLAIPEFQTSPNPTLGRLSFLKVALPAESSQAGRNYSLALFALLSLGWLSGLPPHLKHAPDTTFDVKRGGILGGQEESPSTRTSNRQREPGANSSKNS